MNYPINYCSVMYNTKDNKTKLYFGIQKKRLTDDDINEGWTIVKDVETELTLSKNWKSLNQRKHYYRLRGEELKDFKANYLNDSNLKFISELILWTEKGVARHAKILDTDEVYEIFKMFANKKDSSLNHHEKTTTRNLRKFSQIGISAKMPIYTNYNTAAYTCIF